MWVYVCVCVCVGMYICIFYYILEGMELGEFVCQTRVCVRISFYRLSEQVLMCMLSYAEVC